MIVSCPFTLHNGIYRPLLNLRIINPHAKQGLRTLGLIDTGADSCFIPARLAPILDHNLTEVEPSKIKTAGGTTLAYPHTTTLELYHPVSNTLIHKVNKVHIYYLVGLKNVLLGVDNFLTKHILRIDYPKKIFSIVRPPAKK